MVRHPKELVDKIRTLRSEGKTYGEINKFLNINLAKSTLHQICKNTSLPNEYLEKITRLNIQNLGIARATALAMNKIKRENLFRHFEEVNLPIAKKIHNKHTAKIALAMLCLGEASKSGGKTAFSLGNSDPRIITLFISLLRTCFDNFDPKKLRGRVQCRADQDTQLLENYWLTVSGIPKSQFYKTGIDPRTINKPTKKLNYKGVLNVNYLDTKVQLELESLANLVYNHIANGPVV